jgi:hypothetical protein
VPIFSVNSWVISKATVSLQATEGEEQVVEVLEI